jgi:hypothetical protein
LPGSYARSMAFLRQIKELNGSCLVNVLHCDRQFKFANILFQGGNVPREYSPEGASG